MKTLIKKLPVIAFVLALVAALAFTVPEKADDDTTWFAVAPNGNIGDTPLVPAPECTTGSIYCAVQFDNGMLVDGESPIENVEDPDAEDYYIKVTHQN